MKIRACKNNGKSAWCLDLRALNQGRKIFATKAEAEIALAELSEQKRTAGEAWVMLAPNKRQELMSVAEEVWAAGKSLREVWTEYQRVCGGKPAPTLGVVIAELLESKERAGRRPKFVDRVRLYLGAFAKGREATPVNRLTAMDIEAWFAARSEAPQTRQSNLGLLSSMFEHCWRRGYIVENPCRRVDRVSVPSRAPAILTVEQAQAALTWCVQSQPEFLAWLVLTLIVGLRPEAEAAQLSWGDIDLKNHRIHVSKSKVQTHWRIIDLTAIPNASVWLEKAKQSRRARLPVAYTFRRRCIRRLRKRLGFAKWPQDILRHTAASYLFALHQDAGKVATLLGNSAGTLLRRYRALVVKKEAARFFDILPQPSRKR